MVAFNSNIIFLKNCSKLSLPSIALLSTGKAIPAISAPSAIALAASNPLLIPPLPTRKASGIEYLTSIIEAAVGTPQSRKFFALSAFQFPLLISLIISIAIQLVPPCPEVSKFFIP
uniref:Orf c05009 protein n=1 Tax=Saccharolobus solfataricus TaxID=2287 RepID=P95998_SACSO|nr:orf c05009 [Saccharolobus solfataricus P2]